jgi:hypothetical protein
MKNIELYSLRYLRLVEAQQPKAKQQSYKYVPPSPFKNGIKSFIKTQLKPYAEAARDLIPDQQKAKQLFDKITAYKSGNGQFENEYKAISKYIVMLEDYFIKWLSDLQNKNSKLYQQNFDKNLINVLGAIVKNLKIIIENKNFQYTPFTLSIGGQLPAIDIDEWKRQEDLKKDPGY